MSILVAILVFGMIILIHEFGHFIVAKKCGIGVLEFSIGMGPRLCSLVKGETRYSIKAFPFGGSCMMLGEDENAEDPRAFNNKPVWSRIAVIAAGPVFNFILAFILAIVIIHAVGYDSPRLVGVLDGLPAQEQGMQAGDVITRLNREPVVVYRDVTLYMYLHHSEPVDVEFKRTLESGETLKHRVRLVPRYSQEHGGYMLGIQTSGYREPVKGIGETLKYSAYDGSRAGGRPGYGRPSTHGQHYRRDCGGDQTVRMGDHVVKSFQSLRAFKRQLRGHEPSSHSRS